MENNLVDSWYVPNSVLRWFSSNFIFVFVCTFHSRIFYAKNTVYNLEQKKEDGLLNAHLSTLEYVEIRKPHGVMKALEKSFQSRLIPLL